MIMQELDDIMRAMKESALNDQDLDRLVRQADDITATRSTFKFQAEKIREKAENIKKNRDMEYVAHLSGPEEVQKATSLYTQRKEKGGEKNEDGVDALCSGLTGFASDYKDEDKNLGKATENCLRAFENAGFLELEPDYRGNRAEDLCTAYGCACYLQGDNLSPSFAKKAIENVEDLSEHTFDPIANIAGMNYRLDDKNVAKTYLKALERTMDKYDHVTDGVISISNGLQDIIKANPDLVPECNEIMNKARDHMNINSETHTDMFCEYYNAVNSNPNVSESAKAMARVRKKSIEKQKERTQKRSGDQQGMNDHGYRSHMPEIDKERDEMLERMERDYYRSKNRKDSEIEFDKHKSYGYGRDDGYGY